MSKHLAKTSQNVLLAGFPTLVSQALRRLLDVEGLAQAVWESACGVAAVRDAKRLQPDLVLLDVDVCCLKAAPITRQIRRQCPNTRVLWLSQECGTDHQQQAQRCGAVGCLGLDSLVLQLQAIVHKTAQPETPTPAPHPTTPELTPREQTVLLLLAKGNTIRESARSLAISPKTVEIHRHNIMDKLGRRTIAELTQYALSRALLPF